MLDYSQAWVRSMYQVTCFLSAIIGIGPILYRKQCFDRHLWCSACRMCKIVTFIIGQKSKISSAGNWQTHRQNNALSIDEEHWRRYLSRLHDFTLFMSIHERIRMKKAAISQCLFFQQFLKNFQIILLAHFPCIEHPGLPFFSSLGLFGTNQLAMSTAYDWILILHL